MRFLDVLGDFTFKKIILPVVLIAAILTILSVFAKLLDNV